MLQDLFTDHVSELDLAPGRQLVPELKVLSELGPSFGDGVRKQYKEIV